MLAILKHTRAATNKVMQQGQVLQKFPAVNQATCLWQKGIEFRCIASLGGTHQVSVGRGRITPAKEAL